MSFTNNAEMRKAEQLARIAHFKTPEKVTELEDTSARLEHALLYSQVDAEVLDDLRAACWLSGIYTAIAPETPESLATEGISDSVIQIVDALESKNFATPAARLLYTLHIQTSLSLYPPSDDRFDAARKNLSSLNYHPS